MTAPPAAGAAGLTCDDLAAAGALERFRARFEAVEPRVLAFVDEPRRFDRLRRDVTALQRRAAAEGKAALPLHGVPLGVKDVFRVDGLPTRAGSRLPAAELAGAEAESVRRLRAAGALVVGKTASTELAYFAPAATRNPHHPEHTPGGSSSGSAAAVATGQATLALGTQTIGSVGRPAAFCGVVGFKPSYDRIPRDGVVPLAPSLDHVGVFARDVDWVRRAAAMLCDDWRTGSEPPPARPVLGIPEGPYLDYCGDLGRRHLAAVCEALREAGYEIRPVPVMDDFAAVVERHRRIVAAEAAAAHGSLLERHGDLLRPATVELLRRGQGVDAATLEADRAGRGRLRDELEAAREAAGVDLWITPPATGPAPRGLESTGDPVMNLPWTQAGLPAVVLPAPLLPAAASGGLPLGVQLVAGWWQDEALLAAAAVLETVLASAAEAA